MGTIEPEVHLVFPPSPGGSDLPQAMIIGCLLQTGHLTAPGWKSSPQRRGKPHKRGAHVDPPVCANLLASCDLLPC